MKLSHLLMLLFTINIVFFVLGTSSFSDSLGLNIGSSNPASSVFNLNGTQQAPVLKDNELKEIGTRMNSSDGGIFDALDYSLSVWGLIKSFLAMVFGFFFAPIVMMVALQVPSVIIIIIGVVWVLTYLMAIISAIWRFDL